MVRLVQKLMVAPFDSVLLLLNRDVTGLSYDERDNQLSNVSNDILAIWLATIHFLDHADDANLFLLDNI